jgi:hypothetical protein
MSQHINVNPDHYKVAGRERPGKAVAKASKTNPTDPAAAERWQRREVRSQKAERSRRHASR